MHEKRSLYQQCKALQEERTLHTHERLARIRAAQDATEALAEAVQARLSAEEWHALTAFNTYCANRLGLTLEFYQRESGEASYRFRPLTDAERHAWAEGWVEDHL